MLPELQTSSWDHLWTEKVTGGFESTTSRSVVESSTTVPHILYEERLYDSRYTQPDLMWVESSE